MSVTEKTFAPQIVAFCCRHCAYSAADLAGGARMSYSPSIKIVEMPCTGRANVVEILQGIRDGSCTYQGRRGAGKGLV